MAEFEPEIMEFEDPKLTRIKPDTKFYMDATGKRSKNPKVLTLFKAATKRESDKFIQSLFDKRKISDISQIRYNVYGDILKVK